MMNNPAFSDFVNNTLIPAVIAFITTVGTALFTLIAAYVTNYVNAKVRIVNAHAKSAELETNQKISTAVAIGIDQSHPDAPNEVKKEMGTTIMKEKAVGKQSENAVSNIVEQGVALKNVAKKIDPNIPPAADVEVNVSSTKNMNV